MIFRDRQTDRPDICIIALFRQLNATSDTMMIFRNDHESFPDSEMLPFFIGRNYYFNAKLPKKTYFWVQVVKEFHIKPGGRALISSLLFEILEPLFISLFRNFPSGRLCWSRPSSPIHRVLHSLLQVGESINWAFLIR